MKDLVAIWKAIVKEIPSRHFPPGKAVANRPCGFRRTLGELASQQDGLRYLEIGCRRGHSLALALLAAPSVEEAVAVDLWLEDYGGESNGSPEEVLAHLENLGAPTDRVQFITGDSRHVLPTLQDRRFDLILVDGDHTPEGATRDLTDTWPLLEKGGTLLFDDCERELADAWRRVAASWNHIGLLRGTDIEGPPWAGAVRL